MLRDGGVVVREPQRTRWARWHPASKAKQTGFVTVGLLTLGFGGRNFKPQNLFKNGEQGVWFDPADWSTLFQDSAGTTPVTAVGQPVGKILDKSGGGYFASQATAANRPVLQRDSSGFLYLAFNGTNSSMVTGSINLSASNKLTVFAGFTKLSDATVAVVSEFSVNTNVNNGAFWMLAPNVSANENFLARGTVMPASGVNSGSRAAPESEVTTGIADIGTATQTMRVNGIRTDTNVASLGTGNFGNYPLYIGARGGSSLYFNGRLYGLIVRGAASTPAELTKTERWLGARMGIAL